VRIERSDARGWCHLRGECAPCQLQCVRSMMGVLVRGLGGEAEEKENIRKIRVRRIPRTGMMASGNEEMSRAESPLGPKPRPMQRIRIKSSLSSLAEGVDDPLRVESSIVHGMAVRRRSYHTPIAHHLVVASLRPDKSGREDGPPVQKDFEGLSDPSAEEASPRAGHGYLRRQKQAVAHSCGDLLARLHRVKRHIPASPRPNHDDCRVCCPRSNEICGVGHLLDPPVHREAPPSPLSLPSLPMAREIYAVNIAVNPVCGTCAPQVPRQASHVSTVL